MKVKELLSDESKWCQRALARVDKENEASAISPRSLKATCWCLEGAIVRCYPTHAARIMAEGRIKNALNGDWIYVSSFNDSEATTFADIQRVLELADV